VKFSLFNGVSNFKKAKISFLKFDKFYFFSMNSMFKYPKAENLGAGMFIFYFDFNADATLGA
jgi:hypothetical protein